MESVESGEEEMGRVIERESEERIERKRVVRER